MDPYLIIISLAIIIIISHFLNVYSEKTGVPAVLILILFGFLLQLDVEMLQFEILDPANKKTLLKILGVAGLILILLEAALDLEINKTMIFSSMKALFVALFGLIGTSFLGAYVLQYFSSELDFIHALLYATPLSIISSAIIIPSIQNFSEEKKSFLIYESTFSDVLGLLMFQIIIGSLATGQVASASEVSTKLILSIIFSIFISIFLIYLFQKIRGHVKLFLLFSILILLYSVGEILHLSSLLIILIFGIILNNYKSIFKGILSKLINDEKVNRIQDEFKVIIGESAFVVRTFFFILFGYSVALDSLFNLEVIIISLVLLAIIYGIRFILLVPTLRTRMWPELFLSPRGLITILLFFSIPDKYVTALDFHENIIPGVLLFIILGSALAMSNALITFKNIQLKMNKRQNLDLSNPIKDNSIDAKNELRQEEEIQIQERKDEKIEEEIQIQERGDEKIEEGITLDDIQERKQYNTKKSSSSGDDDDDDDEWLK